MKLSLQSILTNAKKWLTKDLINTYSILNSAKCFAEDGLHKYLTFQPMYRYFTTLANSNIVLGWKSEGLWDKILKPPSTSDCNLNPELNDKMQVNLLKELFKARKSTL